MRLHSHTAMPSDMRLTPKLQMRRTLIGWRARRREMNKQTAVTDDGEQQQQEHKCKNFFGRNHGQNSGYGIRMTYPCTKWRMGGMGRAMMMRRSRRPRVKRQTTGRPDGERKVEHRHPEGQRSNKTSHGAPPRTWRTSATDSSLSHARGPTARPSGRPSGAISTVVGNPRTIKERETS